MAENIKEAVGSKPIVEFDRDTIEREIRARVRHVIEQVVEAELEAALGPSHRSESPSNGAGIGTDTATGR